MLPAITPENTCCFTGHRPNKLPWGNNESDERCIKLKEALFDVVFALYFGGIRHFICGMAMGCDMYFAEAVFALRAEHDDVTIEAALPCEKQAERWPSYWRGRYYHTVSACDYETLLQKEYTKDCMKNRNIYMVDNSSVLVAVYDGSYGGTMQTVNYAVKKGLEIIRLTP